EATTTGTHLGLAGRGLGTTAAAQLAALCISGATIIGGSVYCITGPLTPPAKPDHQRPTHHEPRRPAKHQRAGPPDLRPRKTTPPPNTAAAARTPHPPTNPSAQAAVNKPPRPAAPRAGAGDLPRSGRCRRERRERVRTVFRQHDTNQSRPAREKWGAGIS